MTQLDMFKQQEEDQKKRAAAERELAIYQPIIAALKNHDIDLVCEVEELPHSHRKYDAVLRWRETGNVVHDIELETIYSGEGYWARAKGVGVKVGGYGSRRKFKPLKAGGYNYDGIAAAFAEHVEEQKAIAKRRMAERDIEQRVRDLKTDLGFEYMWSSHKNLDIQTQGTTMRLKYHKYAEADKAADIAKVLASVSAKVTISIDISGVDEDKAREVHAALSKAGLMD